LLTMPKPHSQKSGNTPTPKFNNGRDIPIFSSTHNLLSWL